MKKINAKSEITAKMMNEEKIVLAYSHKSGNHYGYLKASENGYKNITTTRDKTYTKEYSTLAAAKKSLTINHF